MQQCWLVVIQGTCCRLQQDDVFKRELKKHTAKESTFLNRLS